MNWINAQLLALATWWLARRGMEPIKTQRLTELRAANRDLNTELDGLLATHLEQNFKLAEAREQVVEQNFKLAEAQRQLRHLGAQNTKRVARGRLRRLEVVIR